MFRKTMLLLGGNATASLLSLIRNLLIARLISVEDYGIAATFALIMTLVEMATALGLQTQIVQSQKGDDPAFQSALQGFQALRGVISAVILFFAAGAIADFLNLPEIAWAYQMVALVPLLGGFVHFDIYRLNRELRFGPLLWTSTVPMAVTLALVWPLVSWLGDWRVMLVIVVVQSATMMCMSHVVAQRPYRARLHPPTMRQNLSFGWPLLINNGLLFLVFQGDRALVVREMGPEVLAIFSMGVTLTLTPTLVMAKSINNLFLPRLSTEQDTNRFHRLVITTLQGAMLNASVMLLGIFFLGKPMIEWVLGEKYLALVPILGALAGVQALRVLKTGGNVVALSRGHTSNAMISNIFRVLTLPVIWVALQNGAGLGTVIALAAVGEALGYAAALLLVWWRVEKRLGAVILPLIFTFALMVVVAGLLPVSGTALITLVLVLFVAQIASMSILREWLLRRFRRSRK